MPVFYRLDPDDPIFDADFVVTSPVPKNGEDEVEVPDEEHPPVEGD